MLPQNQNQNQSSPISPLCRDTDMQPHAGDGSELYRHPTDMISMPIMKYPARSAVIFSLFLFLLVGAFLSTRTPFMADSSAAKAVPEINVAITNQHPRLEIPLNCTARNLTGKCPDNYPTSFAAAETAATCPDYFRWIHEDLKPWAQTGITREMVKGARRTANFKLVVLKGKAYVEVYEKAFQTRDTFTLWGILQLLRLYPGRIPDLEMMFDCVDWPVIKSANYSGPNATAPPPLFRYCGDDNSLDIVFPDWSFWGWPETHIKPWHHLLKELKQGNNKMNWLGREPYAYWKGNPDVAETRQDLMKCNVSETQDWNARLYRQNWVKESQLGFKQSDLKNQCRHRYKIYIEGSAWSVSEKYILACDSVTLLVKPRYYDFFTRGLMPVHHYWPIRKDTKCKSIKFAVDWGNTHKKKAEAIGRAASSFIQEDLKMELVYDYIFHLLNEYAKLLRFEPRLSENATELCAESMVCEAKGVEKEFMMESLVKGPSNGKPPCKLPPPYDAFSLYSIGRRKESSIKQVEMWEDKYWKKRKQQQP